ncbi:MAG: SPOR domain-containing protein [Candidatus Omnitrophica bacterium]|nr:SPOR domain-containing protein [Candidatus Omnitrophota bacterium]
MRKYFLKKALCGLIFCSCLFPGVMPEAHALNLDKARFYFLNGDYGSCIKEGERILAVPGNPGDIDSLYYLLGLSYLKEGNYLRASDIFEIILKEFKNSSLRQEAKLGLGDAYYLRGQYNKAADCYKDLLSRDHKGKFSGVLYYRLSQCAFKSGNISEGNDYLGRLKKYFPLNPELIVNKDWSCPVSYYTVQVGSFSKSQNAKNLTQRLIQKNYPAYIEEAGAQGKITYRVRVGKFNSQQGAADLADKLSREGYPTKICP